MRMIEGAVTPEDAASFVQRRCIFKQRAAASRRAGNRGMYPATPRKVHSYKGSQVFLHANRALVHLARRKISFSRVTGSKIENAKYSAAKAVC